MALGRYAESHTLTLLIPSASAASCLFPYCPANDPSVLNALKNEWMMHKPYDISEPRNNHNEKEYTESLRLPY